MREWHHVASALHYNAIAVFQGQDLLFQGHRKVWKSEGALVMCGHNLALDVDRVNWAANIWGFHGAPEATLPGTFGSDSLFSVACIDADGDGFITREVKLFAHLFTLKQKNSSHSK